MLAVCAVFSQSASITTFQINKVRLKGSFLDYTGKVVTLNDTDTLTVTAETDTTIDVTFTTALASSSAPCTLTVYAGTTVGIFEFGYLYLQSAVVDSIIPTKVQLRGDFLNELGKIVILNDTDTVTITAQTDNTIDITFTTEMVSSTLWHTLKIIAGNIECNYRIRYRKKNNRLILEVKNA